MLPDEPEDDDPPAPLDVEDEDEDELDAVVTTVPPQARAPSAGRQARKRTL